MAFREIKIVEMIDWYDGIVQAVVSTNWMKGIYLCSLLAFDVGSKKRVFALLSVNESEVKEIKSLLDGEWDMLLLYLKQLWQKASGSVVIVCYEDMEAKVIAVAKIEVSTVSDQAISDVAETVSDSRMDWFSVV